MIGTLRFLLIKRHNTEIKGIIDHFEGIEPPMTTSKGLGLQKLFIAID
jgi:hypothetical protein